MAMSGSGLTPIPAALSGFWADTNTSAELSEDINSMYAWYEGCAICYAWLSDVSSRGPLEKGRSNLDGAR
jgi:hypothetical protein